MNSMQPLKRSKLRIMLGRTFYTYSRYFDWYLSKNTFAKNISEEILKYPVFKHKTPLLRKLKNVDMWMQYNKVVNLKIASARIHKIIIKPGEIFSYWKLIGKPDKSKGYLEGMVLFNGGFKPGVGGGLCQLSNLIYWMVLHTPLTVTERHRHSFDVFPDSNRVLPFGSGATCVYNYRDLQFCNDTDKTFQLIIYMDELNLCGEIRSSAPIEEKYEVYEKNHRITHEFWGGYIRRNEIFKCIYYTNGCKVEELVTENDVSAFFGKTKIKC